MHSTVALFDAALTAAREASSNNGRISQSTIAMLNNAVAMYRGNETYYTPTERYYRALMPQSTRETHILRITDSKERNDLANNPKTKVLHNLCVGVGPVRAYVAQLDDDEILEPDYRDRDDILAWLSRHGYVIL